jgi:hypothetical protein
LKDTDGEIITDSKAMANLLAKRYTGISSDGQYTQIFRNRKEEEETTQTTINVDNMEPYNCPITEEELDQALKSCTGSSPGPDLQIHYVFLKQMEVPERLKVLEIYNKIWSTGEFPSKWTEVIVIPILKPGKDPNEPTS